MGTAHLVACAAATACLLTHTDAAADAAGWFHSGGGVLAHKGGDAASIELDPLMTFDLGVGTSENMPFILGGYFKVQPVLGQGADVAWMARFATLGFQQDWIGFAADAGLYHRAWGPVSTGFLGQAILGLPFGLQLAAIGTVGNNDSFGFGGTLGLDLVRLTVSRKHLLDWWPNPRPVDNLYDTAQQR